MNVISLTSLQWEHQVISIKMEYFVKCVNDHLFLEEHRYPEERQRTIEFPKRIINELDGLRVVLEVNCSHWYWILVKELEQFVLEVEDVNFEFVDHTTNRRRRRR